MSQRNWQSVKEDLKTVNLRDAETHYRNHITHGGKKSLGNLKALMIVWELMAESGMKPTLYKTL